MISENCSEICQVKYKTGDMGVAVCAAENIFNIGKAAVGNDKINVRFVSKRRNRGRSAERFSVETAPASGLSASIARIASKSKAVWKSRMEKPHGKSRVRKAAWKEPREKSNTRRAA